MMLMLLLFTSPLMGNSFDSGFNYMYMWLSFVGFLGFGWVSVFFVILVRVFEGEFYRGYIIVQ